MAAPGGGDRIVSRNWEGPLQPPAVLPASADVVIVGGGIVGASCAWLLARRGISVLLCEKGHIAGEQSGRNWGWVRTMVRDTREIPMMLQSMRIWETMQDEIGEDVGFRRGGCMLLARDSAELQRFEEWLPVAKDYGLDTRSIGREELGRLIRGGAAHWVGALYSASDGRAEPHLAVPAIARAAARHGAHIATSCAVRGVETAAGRVAVVVTEHGVVRTSRVLVAAGAWTSMFCRAHGIDVPQLKVQGTVARLAAGDKVLDGNAYDPRLGIRRRLDGGYTVAHGFVLMHAITPSTFRFALQFLPALRQEAGKLRLSLGRAFIDEWRTPTTWPLDGPSPFERQRVLNPSADPRQLRELRATIDTLFPTLADCDIVESWGGMVETTPDVIPIIGEAAALPGLYIASGFSGHGFGLGPGAGTAAADMLTHAPADIDLTPFRLQRFSDGSRIRPQHSV